MIIDEKVIMFPPPPPYLPGSARYGGSTTTLTYTGRTLTLTSLPPHILLQIIHYTFPQGIAAAPTPLNSASYGYDTARLYEDTKPERQRKTLFWLSTSLRLVSRTLYTACMHILRSTYLPAYQDLIRPSYSSDPFPMGVPSPNTTTALTSSSASITSLPPYETPTTPTSHSPLITPHRETVVLDRFILLKVRQDVFQDDTSLHTDREDAFRDLFDVAQPRARLEDLIRILGVKEGVVYVPGWGFSSSSSSPRTNPQNYGGGGAPSPPPRSASTSTQIQTQLLPTAPTKRRSVFSFLSSSYSSSSSRSSTPPQLTLPTAPTPKIQIQPIPFPALSVSFSPRRVGLILNRSRTVAEVARTAAYGGAGRGRESLEELAGKLVGGLRVWLIEG